MHILRARIVATGPRATAQPRVRQMFRVSLPSHLRRPAPARSSCTRARSTRNRPGSSRSNPRCRGGAGARAHRPGSRRSAACPRRGSIATPASSALKSDTCTVRPGAREDQSVSQYAIQNDLLQSIRKKEDHSTRPAHVDTEHTERGGGEVGEIRGPNLPVPIEPLDAEFPVEVV